ncbi:MAG TPA: hypothetical protein VG096_26485 [Bryobacteraceae bacterium]|jgi:hypothetical protein|nr:hypothetical protein [Bryobacteraceae bacterium]
MDLRTYYQKIRDIETKIEEAFAIVVSLETPDGGKVGTFTEVPAAIAAKMLVDGSARLALSEEAVEFRAQQAEAARAAEQEAAAGRVHLSVVPTSELNQLKSAVRTLQG